MSSTCAIEIEAILFLFMMNCYKSSFQECITIIVLKIQRTRNQPPYRLLQLQEKMAFRLPRSGCLGTPLTLPQSLYGRTDVRWRQNQNFSDRVTKFAYSWCSASSAVKRAFRKSIGEICLTDRLSLQPWASRCTRDSRHLHGWAHGFGYCLDWPIRDKPPQICGAECAT